MKVNELFEASRPRGWAMLPATKVIFDKTKVTPDEVQSELGHGSKAIGLYLHSKGDKDVVVMVPGRNNKEDDNADVYHDQTGRSLGTMRNIGHLVKDKDGWKIEANKAVPGLATPEDLAKFKAPVFVFK